MRSGTRLSWYARRLARMSPAEIAHRVTEQAKKISDARRIVSWESFGRFSSPISTLPGLDLARPPGTAADRARNEAVCRGEFFLLNRRWPDARDDWMDTVWHLDPVSGTRWPGKEAFAFDVDYRDAPDKGDVKFVWEINRLGFLQWLAADASDRDDDEKWRVIVALFRGWMAANPPFRGVNWTNGIEAASRLVSMLVVLGYANEKRRAMLTSLALPFVEAHAHWIDRYPSLYSSANNHRVAELAALFLASHCMPRLPHAARYLRQARDGLEREILRQFHADGVGAEQSPTYAAYSLEWFVCAGVAADARGQPLSADYRDRVSAAAAHLRWMTDDGENAPRIGDDDEGRVLYFHGPAYVASVTHFASRWLGSPMAPPTGVCTFRSGGYSVFREPTDRGTLLLVFDHGPLGFLSIAAHGHADALGVWLHWGDEAILVDAGTYLYHSGGHARDMFRGTPVHNTLAIEGSNQSRIAGPFAWSRHARSRILEAGTNRIVAENDGFARDFGVRHCRGVTREDGRTFRIEDRLLGDAVRSGLRWTMGFLIAPSVTVAVDRRDVVLKTRSGRRLSLAFDGPAGSAWRVVPAAYSSGFNKTCETIRLEVSGDVPADAQLTTEIGIGLL